MIRRGEIDAAVLEHFAIARLPAHEAATLVHRPGKSPGSWATSLIRASIPPAEAPMTTMLEPFFREAFVRLKWINPSHGQHPLRRSLQELR